MKNKKKTNKKRRNPATHTPQNLLTTGCFGWSAGKHEGNHFV